ncbi:MAG TPA: CBS domain-containing protein [Thermodesulfovibrionales bacterium]|nr:CBS domain-containing protein [Thermodesulfovibrionales bacterium]
MISIKELLKKKSGDIWSISPEASVYQALELMAQKDVGALLVIENDKLLGIFSERDYARKVILKGKASKETAVGELMTRSVYYVTPDNTLEEAMALMTSKHIRHLPIMNHGKLVSIVTLGDVVKRIISEQKLTIDELENYLTGGYGA